MENYEQSLKNALNSDLTPHEVSSWLKEHFPELKESEDERIRKAITEFFKNFSKNGTYRTIPDVTKWIVWLENQGRQDMIPIDKVIKFLDEQLVNDKDKVTGESFINFRNYGAYKETFISFFKRKMLEKQGEQKPAEEYNITGIGSKNAQGKLGEMIKNLKPVNEVLEQKHSPKHKVGDTIYYNSFGDVKSMVVADVVTDGTDNPMYEDENGDSVFEEDLIEYNTAWSENDETNLDKTIWYIEKGGKLIFAKTDELVSWLISLKDRVQPQNKWKESLATADLENSLCDIQDGFSDTSYEYRILGEAIEFIRCTESKPQWKPSDEQMEALEHFVRSIGESGYASPYDNNTKLLYSLLEQLKKLKE